MGKRLTDVLFRYTHHYQGLPMVASPWAVLAIGFAILDNGTTFNYWQFKGQKKKKTAEELRTVIQKRQRKPISSEIGRDKKRARQRRKSFNLQRVCLPPFDILFFTFFFFKSLPCCSLEPFKRKNYRFMSCKFFLIFLLSNILRWSANTETYSVVSKSTLYPKREV